MCKFVESIFKESKCARMCVHHVRIHFVLLNLQFAVSTNHLKFRFTYLHNWQLSGQCLSISTRRNIKSYALPTIGSLLAKESRQMPH